MKKNSELSPEEKNYRGKNLLLKAINEYALELTSVSVAEDFFAIAADRLQELTGARAVGISLYNKESEVLVSRYTTLSVEENSLIVDKLGRSLEGMQFKLTPELYSKITGEVIGDAGSLAEMSFGVIPEAAGKVIKKTLGIGWFTRISLLYNGTLLGMLIIAGKKNTMQPGHEELLAFAGITVNALRRWFTEKSLQEIEQNFQALTNNGKALIWTARPDKLCDYFNRTWLEFTGRTFGQEVGYGWAEGVHPDDLKHCLDIYNHAFDRREWFSREYRLRRHDGEFRWFQDDGAPRYDNTGKFIGYIGHCLDITERKRAEQALWESEEKYHTIFETTGTAILIVEKDTTISPANNQAAQINGHDTEELIGRKWPQSVAPGYLEEMIKNHKLKQLKHGKAPDKYEVKLVNKKGEIRDAILEIGRIPETKQGIVSILDITERKQAEEILAYERYLINSLIDSVPDHIYFKDTESRFIRISRAQSEIFGLSHPSQAVGKTDFDFFTEEHAWQAYEDEQEIIRTGRSLTREEKETWPDRPDTWVLTTKIPLRDKVGKIIGTFGISRDITERKQAEEALRLEKENFRYSLDDSPLGVRIATIEGNTIYANKTLLNFYGYDSLEELQKTPLKDRYTPESYIQAQERKRQRERGDLSVTDYEISIVRKNGEIRHLQVFRKEVLWDGIRQFQVICNDITERKRVEDMLQKSELKYRSLIEQAPDAIMIVDAEGNLLHVNLAGQKLLGYSEDELHKMKTIDTYSKDEMAAGRRRLIEMRALRAGGTMHFERLMRRKDGTLFPVEISVGALEDGNSHAIIRDITERKLTEGTLRESEERFQRLSQGLFEGIIIHDEGKIIDTNETFAVMFGYDLSELIGKNALDFAIPELREIAERHIHTKSEEPYEGVVHRKDGSTFDVEVRGKNIPYEGRMVRVTALMDITERKQAEEALRNSEQRIRSITDQITDVVFMTDNRGHITYISPVARSVLGYSQEEMKAAPFIKFLVKSEVPRAMAAFKSSMRSGQKQENLIFLMKRKDGSNFTGELTSNAFSENGRVTGIIGVIRDITERKEAEKEIEKAREQLELLNQYLTKAREEERAAISRDIHDQLGQSLTALKLDLNWIFKNADIDPEISKKLARMIKLVSASIKEVQRISSELRPGILDDLGLAAAVDWYCDEFGKRTGILVQMDIDEVQTENMLKNLTIFRVLQESLTNIIRHAGAKNVHVKLCKIKNDIVLTILDDGIGIPPSKIKDTRSLGIMGMFERVKQSDGHMEITSPDKHGTEVRICIPMKN